MPSLFSWHKDIKTSSLIWGVSDGEKSFLNNGHQVFVCSVEDGFSENVLEFRTLRRRPTLRIVWPRFGSRAAGSTFRPRVSTKTSAARPASRRYKTFFIFVLEFSTPGCSSMARIQDKAQNPLPFARYSAKVGSTSISNTESWKDCPETNNLCQYRSKLVIVIVHILRM